MRLIDADKIDFGKVFIGASDFAKDTREAAQKLIEEQPTAYDVDKAVERLEELKRCEESRAAEYDEAGKLDMMNIHDEKAEAYRNSMRIVKSGGIE